MQSFNPEQQKIIDHILGALLVLAPAGTGKTRVLTERVANAIHNGIPAEKILCVTFTNRAAKEMRDRLEQTCTDDYRKLTIKTFHGLCTQLLRIEAKEIGLPTDFTIFDDTDSEGLLKEVSRIEDKDQLQHLKNFIQNSKASIGKDSLSLEFPVCSSFNRLSSNGNIALHYQSALQQQHALDFGDLVYYTRAMLYCHPNISEKWGNRYELIQVDEVQDTHISEYEVIHHLAQNLGNIALIGDLDQTIYEWRGSQPVSLVEAFTKDFSPTCYNLTYNYRATKNLINAASEFAESFAIRYTQCNPDIEAVEGERIYLHNAESVDNEGEWIAKQIKALAHGLPDFQYNRVAVLTRTNKRGACIAEKLKKANIPCITADQYDLFKKKECKDVLAYLSLLVNPFDNSAFRSILHTFPKELDNQVIDRIVVLGEDIGLKLTDFASIRTFISGEPFKDLLAAYKEGEIVVFDTETTGLSSSKDEIIELGAVKLCKGKQVATFHEFLKNTAPIGDSEQIHKISEAHLALKGRDAAEVFLEFHKFIGNSLLVGHNVNFDIRMLNAHALRLGIKFEKNLWVDTWDISTRFIDSENYKLETLATKLNLPSGQAHRALDDSLTTSLLLSALIPLIEVHSSEREKFIQKYKLQFYDIANQIKNWRDLVSLLLPSKLLNQVVIDSKLNLYYKPCIENLRQLRTFFETNDDPDLDTKTSLHSILELTALVKNIDLISQTENLIPIITIHKAKGLEFDTVFLAGAVDGEFPDFRSFEENGNLEQEKRMFYVALTRAKQQLFITGYIELEFFDKKAGKNKTFPKMESRFIKSIPKQYLQYLSE